MLCGRGFGGWPGGAAVQDRGTLKTERNISNSAVLDADWPAQISEFSATLFLHRFSLRAATPSSLAAIDPLQATQSPILSPFRQPPAAIGACDSNCKCATPTRSPATTKLDPNSNFAGSVEENFSSSPCQLVPQWRAMTRVSSVAPPTPTQFARSSSTPRRAASLDHQWPSASPPSWR